MHHPHHPDIQETGRTASDIKLIVYLSCFPSQCGEAAKREVQSVADAYGFEAKFESDWDNALREARDGKELLVATEKAGLELCELGQASPGAVLSACAEADPVLNQSLCAAFRKVVHGRGVNSLKWACRFIAVNRELPGETIRYGPHPSNVGDLRMPSMPTANPVPAILLLHGGFWRYAYERDMMEEIAVDLALAGVATFNIDYRSSADASWPACLEDSKLALCALLELAADRQLNSERIALLGHSAGGHLALMTAGWAEVELDRAVHSLWALAPLCDLVAADKEGLGDGAVAALLGTPGDEGSQHAASPIAHILTRTDAFLAHGTGDRTVPLAQSRRYIDVATASGNRRPRLLAIEGATHMDLVKRHGPHWPALAGEIVRRLRA